MKRFSSKFKKISDGSWLRYGLLAVVLFTSGFQISCPPLDMLDGIETDFDPMSYDSVNVGDSYFQTEVRAIVVDPRTGNFFVGGHFSSIDNVVAYNIAFYDNASDRWYRLRNRGLVNGGLQTQGQVFALAIRDNFLFVGGNFSQTSGSVPTTGLNNIAKYDIGTGSVDDVRNGTWSPLQHNGLNGFVNALVFSGDDLYVGGSFSTLFTGQPDFNNIASYSSAITCTTNCWQPLPGNGLNGTVHALEISKLIASQVFVGGEFTQRHNGTGGPLNRIVRFDGTSWQPLYGNGLNGTVKALKAENDKLYIGGTFTGTVGPQALVPINRMTIYEFPSNFHPYYPVPGDGFDGEVSALEVKNGVVIAGGSFTRSNDGQFLNLGNIAFNDSLNSTNWIPMPGNGLNASVTALAMGDGVEIRDLYVGGRFTQNADGTGLILNRVVKYPIFISQNLSDKAVNRSLGESSVGNPQLLGLTNGKALNLQITSLAAANGFVYAGGYFTATANRATTNLNYFARFDPLEKIWSPLANNGLNASVEAVVVVGDDLFVGGSFTATADGAVTNLNRLARYNLTTSTWHPVGNNGLNSTVNSLAVKGNELWVGGGFVRTFDSAVTNMNYIGRYDMTTGVWSRLADNGLNGPANSLVFVGNDLYIGGAFTRSADGAYFIFFFTRYNTIDEIYYELGNSGTNYTVDRLALVGSDIYVRGQFTRTHDNTIVLDRLGRYNITSDSWSMVSGDTSARDVILKANAFVDSGNELYVGGAFHGLGDSAAHYLTRFYKQEWVVPAPTSDWFDGNNWRTGSVPAANSNALIPAGSGNINISTADVTLGDLIVSGGNISVGAGRSLTINGNLTLKGGAISGPGTVIIANCQPDGILGGDAAASIQATLVRCVNNFGTYNFPVGTANGFSPITVKNVTGTGNILVKANQGPYSGPAMYLPANRLGRWWQIENPGGGVANSEVIFSYLQGDIVGNETNYRAYRISGGAASVFNTTANTFSNRVGVPNVTAYSDWTLADFVPTAANVSVGGRVLTANGNGINKAVVTLTDQSGGVRRTITNSFGYYRFDEVEAGQTHVLTVGTKRYQFAEPTRVIAVSDDALDLNFMALP